MDKVSIIERIYNNDNVLSIPNVISKFLELTEQEDYSANDLAKIILKDPSLTGKILKLSNSSFYARGSKITSINQAISILGMITVKCLALSTSIFNPEKIATGTGIDTKEFFAYILSVASAAELIARALKYPSPEEVLIAGILQDVGIFYFLHHHPKEYKNVFILQDRGVQLMQAEQDVLGANHCVVGYHLSKNWNLPDNITKSIANHHNITEAQEKDMLGNIIKLAVLLTLNRFSTQYQNLEERLNQIHRISSLLKISGKQLEYITEKMLVNTFRIALDIGVEIEDTELLLSKANSEIWKSYLTINRLFKEREDLNLRLIDQEREKAAIKAKNTALATLSHYLNNMVMVISGQSQLLRLMKNQGKTDELIEKIPSSTDIINDAIIKIGAVMQEIRKIAPSDKIEYFTKSEAMNIDDRIKKRLEIMQNESGAIFPENSPLREN